jgi:hypothetical protein
VNACGGSCKCVGDGYTAVGLCPEAVCVYIFYLFVLFLSGERLFDNMNRAARWRCPAWREVRFAGMCGKHRTPGALYTYIAVFARGGVYSIRASSGCICSVLSRFIGYIDMHGWHVLGH